jgi:GDPmannose 4,6-dehydratase
MRALLCGLSGQDGAYLARYLLQLGYEVYGTSRDAQAKEFSNLKALGIHKEVTTLSLAVNDFRSVLQAVKDVEPDEIYNLSGQSSVGLSFEQPVETIESVAIGVLNFLEAIRFTGRSIRFYNAGSSEVFGNTGGKPANEETAFHPNSPYAVAKASAYWLVANYRAAYKLFACTGILFNHESPLRPKRFVTQKVISTACRIRHGSQEKLKLGNVDIVRDWGWAPEYVRAMQLMMQRRNPEDFVIATGMSISLKEFVKRVFAYIGLSWRDHVQIDASLYRPADIMESYADPSKASRILGWKAKYSVDDIICYMMEAELNRSYGGPWK